LKNPIFGGYITSKLPKLGDILGGLNFNLQTKFGPLSTLYLALRRGRIILVLGG